MPCLDTDSLMFFWKKLASATFFNTVPPSPSTCEYFDRNQTILISLNCSETSLQSVYKNSPKNNFIMCKFWMLVFRYVTNIFCEIHIIKILMTSTYIPTPYAFFLLPNKVREINIPNKFGVTSCN